MVKQDILEYGPYTPQEIERITAWLKTNQIAFDLIKDEETEKLAMMNDGENLVTRVEYRTTTYLGQIFYIQISTMDTNKKAIFENLFAAKKENFKAQPSARSEIEDQKLIAVGAKSQHLKKRTWAMVLSILLIGVIVVSFIL
ncbi:MAG: hypothetical protein WA160_01150 [Pseudobdellovibrio sp.]